MKLDFWSAHQKKWKLWISEFKISLWFKRFKPKKWKMRAPWFKKNLDAENFISKKKWVMNISESKNFGPRKFQNQNLWPFHLPKQRNPGTPNPWKPCVLGCAKVRKSAQMWPPPKCPPSGNKNDNFFKSFRLIFQIWKLQPLAHLLCYKTLGIDILKVDKNQNRCVLWGN